MQKHAEVGVRDAATIWFLAACLALYACARPAAPTCVDVLARDNSAATTAAFAARHCQGGGVTWGALLAAAHGTGLTFDDEGDAVRVCGDPTRVDEVRRTHQRLNSDDVVLRAAMATTSALSMECLEADGKPPQLPTNMYPVPTER